MPIAPMRAQKESKRSYALKRQAFTGSSVRHEQPFTLNPVWGDGKLLCPFRCAYCYTQKYYEGKYAEARKRKPSGKIFFRPWLPEILDHELSDYQKDGFPQHLKRVQINEAFEYYIPEIMNTTKDCYGKDLLHQIFEVFKKHWDAGNKWILHILTKSPHILRHKDILSQMKHMVQVEMTIICLDDEKRKLVAPNAPSVPSRLKAIKELSDTGIFVRVMGMPFFGDKDRATNIKEIKGLWGAVHREGAQAFSHKNLNYTTWPEVIDRKSLAGEYNKRNSIYEPLLVKSGNVWRDGEGAGRLVLVKLPEAKWTDGEWKNKLLATHVPLVDFGYAEINDVNWEYIYSAGFDRSLNEPKLLNHIMKVFAIEHIKILT